MDEKPKAIIIVENGMVREVYANQMGFKYVVVDLDCGGKKTIASQKRDLREPTYVGRFREMIKDLTALLKG